MFVCFCFFNCIFACICFAFLFAFLAFVLHFYFVVAFFCTFSDCIFLHVFKFRFFVAVSEHGTSNCDIFGVGQARAESLVKL